MLQLSLEVMYLAHLSPGSSEGSMKDLLVDTMTHGLGVGKGFRGDMSGSLWLLDFFRNGGDGRCRRVTDTMWSSFRSVGGVPQQPQEWPVLVRQSLV